MHGACRYGSGCKQGTFLTNPLCSCSFFSQFTHLTLIITEVPLNCIRSEEGSKVNVSATLPLFFPPARCWFFHAFFKCTHTCYHAIKGTHATLGVSVFKTFSLTWRDALRSVTFCRGMHFVGIGIICWTWDDGYYCFLFLLFILWAFMSSTQNIKDFWCITLFPALHCPYLLLNTNLETPLLRTEGRVRYKCAIIKPYTLPTITAVVKGYF